MVIMLAMVMMIVLVMVMAMMMVMIMTSMMMNADCIKLLDIIMNAFPSASKRWHKFDIIFSYFASCYLQCQCNGRSANERAAGSVGSRAVFRCKNLLFTGFLLFK